MKNLILVLALTGCGGESFTGFTSGNSAEVDGGFDSKIATGGSGDDGGVLPTGTGGRDTGGAVTATGGDPGTGGVATAGTGGMPGTGGTLVTAGGSTGTGGATMSTGGVTGTGGSTNTAVCCVFQNAVMPLSCDTSSPWFCSGAQTFSCAQQGKCALGMTCYASGGPYGGTVELCSATCTSVTHSNGLGQTWQDCVPLGTYNESQATKACKASGAAKCVSSPTCNGVVYGYDTAGTQIYGGSWGYGGSGAGYVVPAAKLGSGTCPGPAVVGVQTWN